jgi:hypothetical protein
MASLTKAQSELIAFLFASGRNRITGPMSEWITTSPRYAAFVAKYKDKIRKKLRVTREPEPVADLLAELRIPYLILQEKRFAVAYEPYASGKARGPDLAVTYRSNLIFNVEITHARGLGAVQGGTAIDPRLVDIVCGKLSQTVANMPNVLLVVSSGAISTQVDLAAHIDWIKTAAERGDSAFYARTKFANASAFFKHWGRLSALALSQPSTQLALWRNPQARVDLPAHVLTALRRAFDPPSSPSG